MELELTRRCRRNVAVAEFVAAHATSSNGTRTGHGLEAAPASAGKAPLFRGVVELLYARNVWLAARTDIWASRGNCFRQGAGKNATEVKLSMRFNLTSFACVFANTYLQSSARVCTCKLKQRKLLCP
jgi:hypothetical protein